MWNGWDNKFHSDIDPFCLKILGYHFPDAIVYTDIREADFTPWHGQIDVLSGGFPCFVAGTPVLTENGLKPIEEIRYGEKVYTKEGRLKAVNAAMRNEVEQTVKIKAQGVAEPIETTHNHPFWVKKLRRNYLPLSKKHGKAAWVDAKDIRNGDMVGYRCIGGTSALKTAAFWYMVGYYLGNGWILDGKRTSKIQQGHRGSRVNSKNWKVVMCCNKSRKDHLLKIISDAGYKCTVSEDRTTYKFIICSKELVEFLYDFGRYAHGKRLPGVCFELIDDYKKALFEGWADADGYSPSESSFRVTTVSEELAYSMAQIARDCYKRPVSVCRKIPNRKCVIEGREVNERPQFNVSVSPNSRYGYYEDGFIWCLVKKVSEENKTTTVYNIAVEEDETYTVYGITVHNCQPFSQAGKRQGTSDDRHLWPEMLRAIREIRPRWVVGENVLGITNWNGGMVFEQVCADLEAEGYSVQPFILPACGVNAPHQRYRTWFIAHRNDHQLRPGVPFEEQLWETSIADGGTDVGHSDRDGARAERGSSEGQNAESGGIRGNGGRGIVADSDHNGYEMRTESDGQNDCPEFRDKIHFGASRSGIQRTTADTESVGFERRSSESGRPDDNSAERPYILDGAQGSGVQQPTADTESVRVNRTPEYENGYRQSGEWRGCNPDDSCKISLDASDSDCGGLERSGALGRNGEYALRENRSNGENGEFTDADGQMPQCGDDEGSEGWDFERFGTESFGGTFSWQEFPTQSPVCGRDDGFSSLLYGITFPRWRKESIKAYGNAIVPQLAYRIFRVIEFMSNGR